MNNEKNTAIIIIDDNFLFYHNLYLEELIQQYGFFGFILYFFKSKTNLIGNLLSLPYNTKLINIIHNNFKTSSKNIILPTYYRVYDQLIKKNLGDNIHTITYFDNLIIKKNILKEMYSKGIIMCKNYINKDEKNIFYKQTSNIFSYFYYKLNNYSCISSYFIGQFLYQIIYSFFFYIPMIFISIILLRQKTYLLKQSTFRYAFINLLLVLNIAHRLRAFKELSLERKMYHKSYQSYISKNIINGDSYYIWGLIIIIYTLLLIYMFFKSFKVTLAIIPIGLSYYVTIFMPFFVKYLLLIITMICSIKLIF